MPNGAARSALPGYVAEFRHLPADRTARNPHSRRRTEHQNVDVPADNAALAAGASKPPALLGHDQRIERDDPFALGINHQGVDVDLAYGRVD